MEITYASPSNSDFADGSSMPTTTRPVRIIPLQHPNASSSNASTPPWRAALSRWKSKVLSMTWIEWLELFLPCFRWIRTYKWREYLQVDLMAGITVGVMLVPQVCLLNSVPTRLLSTFQLVSVLCLAAVKIEHNAERKFPWLHLWFSQQPNRTDFFFFLRVSVWLLLLWR